MSIHNLIVPVHLISTPFGERLVESSVEVGDILQLDENEELWATVDLLTSCAFFSFAGSDIISCNPVAGAAYDIAPFLFHISRLDPESPTLPDSPFLLPHSRLSHPRRVIRPQKTLNHGLHIKGTIRLLFSSAEEVRNIIYAYCVPALEDRYELDDLYDLRLERFRVETSCFLRTCKQIYLEAKPILYAFATNFTEAGYIGAGENPSFSRFTLRGVDPFRLSLVRDLQFQLEYACPFCVIRICLSIFLKDCGEDLRNLRVLHIHFSKALRNTLGSCAGNLRDEPQPLAEFAESNANLRTVKVSGNYDRKWLDGL
ncbi:hypothetical protein DL764_000471 [Monosporascus ibericus]|uniref:Uncharacterized protein n=1 Tax=Monosporascus ibericus TaxID=155417 RepID=A0A4Q4TTC6_9PEZI|nr:hypothetical protein DL764_000471 [Monosporascus ibericus]